MITSAQDGCFLKWPWVTTLSMSGGQRPWMWWKLIHLGLVERPKN